MKIFDVAITVVLIGVGAGLTTLPTEPTQCGPDDVCNPIDPQKPPQHPPNCFFDEEGGLVCYPVDQSGK